jgi:hypothetical protein
MHDVAKFDCNSYSPNLEVSSELLEFLRFRSTAPDGYFNPPVVEEDPMPERVFRRRRTSANADF